MTMVLRGGSRMEAGRIMSGFRWDLGENKKKLKNIIIYIEIFIIFALA